MNREKKDHALNEYWADPRRFADLFNGVLFEGEQILKPEELRELDSAYPTTVQPQSGKWKKDSYSLARYRDIVKMAAYGAEFQIITAVENQNKVHYAMPVRELLYDALGYVKQCKQIALNHKNKKYKSRDEFLSQFAKDDLLVPIFTITLYY